MLESRVTTACANQATAQISIVVFAWLKTIKGRQSRFDTQTGTRVTIAVTTEASSYLDYSV